MKTKIYEFSYGSTLKKVISKSISLMYNMMINGIILFIYVLLITAVNDRLKHLIGHDILELFRIIEIGLAIVISSVFFIPPFFKQKVEISEKIVKIRRHCLFFSPLMIYRGFNDTILISQIDEIYRPTSKDKLFEPIPVNVVDWDNMVIIKLNNSLGTTYYMPVKNSDDFINEMHKRRIAVQVNNSIKD